MNEVSLGYDWPKSSKVRLTRTVEAIQIIRKLWDEGRKSKQYGDGKYNSSKNNSSSFSNSNRGEEGFIDFNGQYFLIRQAKLYTPPVSQHIPIYFAATGSQSAKAAAKFSDGLLTFLKPIESRNILDAFNDTARKENNKDPSSLHKIAEYKISFSEDYDNAFESTKFWQATLIGNVFNSSISDPRQLQQKAERQVNDESIKKSIDIITSIEDCIKPIEEYFKAGFTQVYVHSTSPDEINFVQAFSKRVLPYFNQHQIR